MKYLKTKAIGIALLICVNANAVVDQRLELAGTNLVLSWPSTGNEQYMIEYRPVLTTNVQWLHLTNGYPANGTNRSTYTIPCCALVELAGTNAYFASSSSFSLASSATTSPALWAVPADGSGAAVPLAIYPQGFNTNTLIIFEKVRENIHRAISSLTNRQGSVSAVRSGGETNGNTLLGGISNGGCDCPGMGFFRVWHVPDWNFNVTNYTYDGPTFLPVDFADYQDRVADVRVLLDDQVIADAVFMPYVFTSGETNWGMGIYFDLFTNGTYQIQLVTTLRLNDEVGDSSSSVVLSNEVKTITVDNEVTFAGWDDLIQSTNFTFYAQTKTNETDWWIDILDASENYVKGGSGHTSNGQISWTWDLKDTYGTLRDNLDTDPFFYTFITFTASTGQSATRRTPAVQTEYPEAGAWLFTYADRYYLDVKPGTFANVHTYFITAMNGLAAGPGLRQLPNSTYPIQFGTNVYNQQERNDSWSEVKARLYDPGNRNFYYHGHGSANTIGCDMHSFDTNNGIAGGILLPGSKAYIASLNISNEITFNRHGGSRPYRFVWLDGCSTANGNWPGAFGVDKAAYGLDHYTNSASNSKHRRPSGFVGWNRPVGTGGVWGSAQDAYNFRSEWMTKWYYSWQTEGLWQAFKDARQSANWPPGGDSQLFEALRVYGYTNLLMNGYNQKSDWRWP